MNRRRSVFKTVVAPIIAAVAIMPTFLIAVWEVLHGRGAATYSNVYGLPIHYTSVLIFASVFALAAAAMYIARLVYFWRSGHDKAAKLPTIGSLKSSADSHGGK
jgi:hypothetical protein